MKIWDDNIGDHIEAPEALVAFYEELEKLCKKHNFSISHQDEHGGFRIVSYDQDIMEWLKAASKSY